MQEDGQTFLRLPLPGRHQQKQKDHDQQRLHDLLLTLPPDTRTQDIISLFGHGRTIGCAENLLRKRPMRDDRHCFVEARLPGNANDEARSCDSTPCRKVSLQAGRNTKHKKCPRRLGSLLERSAKRSETSQTWNPKTI